MNKILISFLILSAATFAWSDNGETQDLLNQSWKSYDVSVNPTGKTFEIDIKTKQDMPNAVGLEIAALHIVRPSKGVPGVLSLTVRPASSDAWIDMVGPQKGTFKFSKAAAKEAGIPLPMGRYRFDVNGEFYGVLIVTKGTVELVQLPHIQNETSE